MSDRTLENQVKTFPTTNPDDPRLSPAYRRTTEEHQVVTAKLSELEEELRQNERRYQMLHLNPAYRRITEEHQIVTAKLSQVEEELRQSERRYQMLIERASDVVYLINEQGFFIYTNPAARRLLEYETSSLVGRHFTEFLAPDWKERVAAFYRKQLQDQLPETILEFPVVTRSGQTKWVEQVVTPIVHDGQVIGFQSIARDVTQRKTVEETLRNTTAQLNMLVDNLQAGILMENSQRQIVFVNQAFCTMFGVPVPPAMLIGADCSAAAEQSRALFADTDIFIPRIAELLAERRMVTAEELALVDGRTLERDYIPLFVEGVYQGHLWQYRDITERKQMENAVVESERHLRYLKKRVETILNHSSDAIVVTYGDGTIQQANPAFYSLLGYQPDEIYRDPLVTVIHADYVALLHEKMAAVLADRTPQRIELLIQRKDGSTLPAEAGLSVIALNEDVPGVICSIRDVTGYKQLEKNLRQALEKERELGELKLRFVSMASHEFRTPLATIQTTADALRHYFHRMDEEQREKRFNKIQAQVQHMTLMLDEVLTLGHLQNHKLDFSPVPTEIGPFMQEIMDDVRCIHGETHHFFYTGDCDHLEAAVDRKLLRQIVLNLLTNAVKYSASDTSIYCTVFQEQETMMIQVRDEGIGIPEADQKHLFDAFYRGSNVGTISGTGLGLNIISQAVQLHRGAVTFESTVGSGTTFTICIPINQSE